MRCKILFFLFSIVVKLYAQQSNVVEIYMGVLNFEKQEGKAIIIDYDALKNKPFFLDAERYKMVTAKEGYNAYFGHDYGTKFVEKWINEPQIPETIVLLESILSEDNIVEFPQTELAVKLSDSEMKNLYARYKGRIWQILRTKMNVFRITTFSKIALNGDYAAIFSSSQCEYLCGSGDLFVLKRIDGKWQIYAVLNVWMS